MAARPNAVDEPHVIAGVAAFALLDPEVAALAKVAKPLAMMMLMMVKGVAGKDDLQEKMKAAVEDVNLRTVEQQRSTLARLVEERVSASRESNREDLAKAIEPFLKSRRPSKRPKRAKGRARRRAG